jgi:hypothetical protein
MHHIREKNNIMEGLFYHSSCSPSMKKTILGKGGPNLPCAPLVKKNILGKI